MEKFIPYGKLSKKEKRRMNQAKRQTWGNLNPVTRKPQSSKVYNRNKARNWKREWSHGSPNPGIFLFHVRSLHIDIRDNRLMFVNLYFHSFFSSVTL